MTQADLVAYYNKKYAQAKQLKAERKKAHNLEARSKHLYTNPNAPIPDAKARIKAAIAAAEQTQRNIEALTKDQE